MKKIIISVLIVILIVIAYFMLVGNFTIGNFSIKNIQGIKAMDEQLKTTIQIAQQQSSQQYVSKLDTLKQSIQNLEKAKVKYEEYNSQGELGVIQLDVYKIEYLWTIIGQYAKNRNVQLTMEVAETSTKDLYNLNFSLIGDYSNIVKCLSDIEDDDSLNFKIANFNMEPYTTITTTQDIEYTTVPKTITKKEDGQTIVTEIEKESAYTDVQITKKEEDTTEASIYNPKSLIAKFQVQNIGIDFN